VFCGALRGEGCVIGARGIEPVCVLVLQKEWLLDIGLCLCFLLSPFASVGKAYGQWCWCGGSRVHGREVGWLTA
jgi:hypothetical protein